MRRRCCCAMRRAGSHRARGLCAGGAARKRQQRNVARALDGHAQPALMPRAYAGHAPRQNLAALLHELRKNVRALVVDEIHLLDAEFAYFLLAEILALAARTPARTSRTAAWAALSSSAARATFPARAAVTSGASFALRSLAWRLCRFLFLCHD